MGNYLNKAIAVSEIAKKLNLDFFGADLEITKIVSLHQNSVGALSFSSKIIEENSLPFQGVVIAPIGSVIRCATTICVENPRLTFVKILEWLNSTVGFKGFKGESKIHQNSSISPLAYIGSGVEIGSGTVIAPFAVIMDGTIIGKNCVIKSHASIGEDGFGFERDYDGVPLRMIHLGRVIIGNSVEVGAFNTICRGTLGNTVIEDGVKMDDHVHVAHNCLIKTGALITACAELSGGVTVGRFAWVGPNASIIQKVSIGDHAFIGIAAVVTKSIDDGVTVFGNPARVLTMKSN